MAHGEWEHRALIVIVDMFHISIVAVIMHSMLHVLAL